MSPEERDESRIDPKTRRRLPTGIRYRKDRGKYQARVWGVGLNGEWKERSFLVASLAEAKRLRADSQARNHPGGSMSLNAWHTNYWPVVEGSIRPSTARAYDVAWRLRVKPWLGHRKVETITAGDVEAALTGWSGSASTRIDALSLLSRLLDGAVRARLIALNPTRLARRPRADAPTSLRSRALTAREVQALLESVQEGAYRRYLAGLVYTGMRTSEASALRVEDVDISHRTINVRRSFGIGIDGAALEQSPKSHKERAVPLPAVLLPYVLEAVEGKSRSSLVFDGPKGGRLNASNVRRAVDWKALRERLHRSDFRIHDLRHTLATLLFDGGSAANDVQAILGHSTMQVTERYSRARSDVAQRAARTLDSLFTADEEEEQ